MGTHPIFESDFDCLTDGKMLETLSQQPERLLSVKSKFDAEFRRFAISTGKTQYDEFKDKVRKIHKLDSIDFIITYSTNGDLLPINNNDNYHKALQSTYDGGIIKVYIHRKNTIDLDGYGTSTVRRRKGEKTPVISTPVDFRPVSAIIDVDILPETLRRVRLHKHGSDKPLGFYIRDGFSVRLSDSGVEKVPSIFISRLVNGGLAEMTGLLAVDDEVLEVNSIEVAGKSLDQVTDMMVANSANLIITVKPASQRDTIPKNYKNLNYPPPPLESDSESDEDEIREMPSPSTAAKKTRPKDSIKAQRDKMTI